MSGLAFLAAYIPNVTFSRQLLIPKYRIGVQDRQNETSALPCLLYIHAVLPDYRGHFFNFLLMLLFSFVGWEP